jgi:hypothetical protein
VSGIQLAPNGGKRQVIVGAGFELKEESRVTDLSQCKEIRELNEDPMVAEDVWVVKLVLDVYMGTI